MKHENTRAAWLTQDLSNDPTWIYELNDTQRRDLTAAIHQTYAQDRPLLDYHRQEFDLGTAWPTIAKALKEIRDGTGFALLRGLPRADLTEPEFQLLTWAIGLHTGVARPQGKASQYLSAVRDAGVTYRTGKGRGYSSNADLDFHTDSADVVLLTCFNVARTGGQSLVSSSVAAHDILAAERPDQAELLHQPFHFSRQQEQAPDEPLAYPNPVYDVKDGLLFSKWNRNRLNSAQAIEGVPQLTQPRLDALDHLDTILRRPEICYGMYLQPGDMQILNNHVTLHSRTEFEDFDEPDRKRSLFRLWLAPPDSVALPETWQPAYHSTAPGSVRGGIIGQAMDDARRDYEQRQANDLGMAA